MFKKLFLALGIGVLITGIVVQRDPTFKKVFAAQFKKAFEQAYDCTLSCTLQEINLLRGQIVVQDMRVRSNDTTQWTWKCGKCLMGFSWLHALLYRSFELHVVVDDLVIESGLENGAVAVAPHLQKLMVMPDLPVALVLRSLSVSKARCIITDEDADARFTLGWRSESRQIEQMFKTNLFLAHGAGTMDGTQIYSSPKGSLHVDVSGTAENFSTNVKANCSFVFPHLGTDTTCYLTGSLAEGRGRFALQNASKSLLISPIVVREERGNLTAELQARFPFSCVQGLMSDLTMSLDATCMVRARYEWGKNKSHGHGQLLIDDMSYGDRELVETARFSFVLDDDLWHGKVYVRGAQHAELSGSWSWLPQQGGCLRVSNNAPLKYSNTSYWSIKPQQFELAFEVDTDGAVVGSYHGPVVHSKLALEHTIEGNFSWKDGIMSLAGSCDDDTYEFISPGTHAQTPSFVYTGKDGTQLISVECDSENNVHGTVQFPFIKKVITHMSGYELQGQGTLELAGTYEDELYKLHVNLNDAHIRLPRTYNFVHKAQADVQLDMNKRKLVIKDFMCDLHRGQIRSARIVSVFDERGKAIFVHAPCTLNKCLLNMERDLFTIISGSFLLTKQRDTAPALQGAIILERSHLKRNIFNESFQQHLFTFDTDPLAAFEQPLTLDLSVQTKHPIQIKTSFLETSAKVNLKIKHDRTAPTLSGNVELLGGTIAFPYTSLHISKGIISFVPQQWHDPLIELVAKNNIRKHMISMRATGSLKQHHIAFESTSPLTEEQIVALLLAGSEEGSLDVVMPALIMQNVKTMIFGPEDSASTVTSYFKKILEPLKHIHLVPSFSDQTGRGGLRAALEIDVSDHWHARLQKNFSLSEDTKFEVEYQLSDDMSLKGTRDERGDVSSEVEMRWKF